jgi:hypothetical protein
VTVVVSGQTSHTCGYHCLTQTYERISWLPQNELVLSLELDPLHPSCKTRQVFLGVRVAVNLNTKLRKILNQGMVHVGSTVLKSSFILRFIYLWMTKEFTFSGKRNSWRLWYISKCAYSQSLALHHNSFTSGAMVLGCQAQLVTMQHPLHAQCLCCLQWKWAMSHWYSMKAYHS